MDFVAVDRVLNCEDHDQRIDAPQALFLVRIAMLTKKDVELIGNLLDVRFTAQDKKIDKKFSEFRTEFRHELHEDMQQMIRASEAGMIRRIDESQQAILEAISEVVMPELQEHTREITKIKHHLQLA